MCGREDGRPYPHLSFILDQVVVYAIPGRLLHEGIYLVK